MKSAPISLRFHVIEEQAQPFSPGQVWFPHPARLRDWGMGGFPDKPRAWAPLESEGSAHTVVCCSCESYLPDPAPYLGAQADFMALHRCCCRTFTFWEAEAHVGSLMRLAYTPKGFTCALTPVARLAAAGL